VRLVGHLAGDDGPSPMSGPTRAQRLTMPLARDAVRQLAEARGGCIRPVQLRRTDTQTGRSDVVLIPCGSTREDRCRGCALRARSLRAQQCREGWHLDNDPDLPSPIPDEVQERWLILRAEAQARRDNALAKDSDARFFDELIGELDERITAANIRGCVTPAGHSKSGQEPRRRRSRSTRRRQDAPDLPSKPVTSRTTGKVFTAPDGKAWRPSMFITLTCDSYGKVGPDGIPGDPANYDYRRAARDALHFAALFDRLIQNLRRYLGYDVQYFATIEPQKRLAPHAHVAVRGAVSRADLRQVIAATYHQVWWPRTDTVRYEDDDLPVWDERTGRYVDPGTGELLPSWDLSLDAIGADDEPLHVARFGSKFDAQGVIAGSKDVGRCIGYLTKYLTKQLGGCHQLNAPKATEHAALLVDALRYEPCSPTCANWLRYGITPHNPGPGLRPGHCKGKAHHADYLGYAGRRVLVSRRWSGKTLDDHRGDRRAWLMHALGLSATQLGRYTWQRITPADADYLPPAQALLHVLTDRARWEGALELARRRAQEASDPPARGWAA
jgi:hypothetical protein